MIIAYTCACGHKGKAEPGQIKYCPDCGAGCTLGSAEALRVTRLTMTYVQAAAKRYIGNGPDAPLLTDRQMQDRKRELRDTLTKFKVKRVTDLKDSDYRKFLDAMGLH